MPVMHARKRVKKRNSRLKVLRRSQGKTLQQVASELGAGKPTVCDWERGRRRPSPRYIPAYAQILGISANELAEMTA